MVAIIAAIGSFFLVRSAIIYASIGAGTALSSEAWQPNRSLGSQPTTNAFTTIVATAPLRTNAQHAA